MAQVPATRPRHFASDTYAPICPEALAAMQSVNANHVVAYGDDQYTADAVAAVRSFFSAPTAEVFFVSSGTVGNALALAALVQPFQAVVTHDAAHVNVDECGAPEFFTGGAKLLTASGANGKITPEAFNRIASARKGDVHFPQVGAVVITQCTEMGTVYSLDQVRALVKMAKSHRAHVLMDGARFCNALVSLGCTPAELTWESGVDVLVCGNSKLGGALAEAVVFFNTTLAQGFRARVKQAGQLLSKARFYTAPWVPMIKNETWKRNAANANEMAKLLGTLLENTKNIKIMFPVEANSVFVEMQEKLIEAIHALNWKFYLFIGDNGCRLMCSWDTTEEDVRQFAADIKREAAKF